MTFQIQLLAAPSSRDSSPPEVASLIDIYGSRPRSSVRGSLRGTWKADFVDTPTAQLDMPRLVS